MNRPKLRSRFSLVATIGLAIVWVLLWGDLSLGAALWGILVALVIQLLFPLPDVPELRYFRPIGFARLVVVTLWGLSVSSFLVAVKVLAFWRPTQNAIVRVPLRSSSMFITAITAELITLVPGSIALDAGERWVLVHVFDASTPERIERARRSAGDTEATALRAFGTAADRALLEED
ncbi:Na+/H+ antiporter subunit E [Agrococcus sp. ProA11]|uniref:Na+/H+ antiporter subunit E n=1 Tax=Agrococcus chionoecetis TaxID=3153752 RepID=UPI00326178EA